MGIIVMGFLGEPSITTVPWSTGSMSDISEMLKAADAGSINITDFWSVGDQRSISYKQSVLGDTTRTWVLTDLNGTTSGNTKYNAVIHTKELASTSSYMNSTNTNVGGWRDSYMRSTTMSSIYNALPSDFKSLIKQASIISGAGNKSDTAQTTSDYIWLFSEREVQGSRSYSGTAEYNLCKQFSYFTTTNNKIKTGNSGSYPGYWWLRSPTVNGSSPSIFCSVYSAGSANIIGASLLLGVSPAAII